MLNSMFDKITVSPTLRDPYSNPEKTGLLIIDAITRFRDRQVILSKLDMVV